MAKTNVKYEYKVKDTFNEVNSRSKFKNAFKHILNALKALPADAYVEEPIVEEDVSIFDANLTEIQRAADAEILDVKINTKTIPNARENMHTKNQRSSKGIEDRETEKCREREL